MKEWKRGAFFGLAVIISSMLPHRGIEMLGLEHPAWLVVSVLAVAVFIYTSASWAFREEKP